MIIYLKLSYEILILVFITTGFNFISCNPKVEFKFLFPVDFDTSMKQSDCYIYNHDINSFWFKLARDIYNDYVENIDNNYRESPRIPKIVHHIWLGSPVPNWAISFIETWKKYNPDWKFILWTDDEVESFNLVNREAYNAATNWGEKSDIVRYEVLYRYGGLYVDTDFECLKPFDIFHHSCDFFIGMNYTPKMYFGILIGIIGSKPGHPLLKRCIDSIRPKSSYETDDAEEIQARTGPYFITKCWQSCMQEKVNLGLSILFPVTFFYPWPHMERFKNSPEEIQAWIRPETAALHYWNVSWNK